MKKVFIILGGFLLLIVGLTYWSISTTDEEFSTCEILVPEDAETIDFRDFDSVLVAASTLYRANAIKRIMQGEQYRQAWATPIKVPIVFLDTLMGGMKVIEQGGGKQTHSLELEASNGVRYSLRSITKNPAPLIPDIARTLGLENIVIDGISAQHPYASLVTANLAAAADILHTHPRTVFVPRQRLLDTLNDTYGNRLYMLEYETEGKKDWTGLSQVEEIMDTDDLQEFKMVHGEQLKIDQSALIRARLFDFLIGDWDRHAKQWGWVVQKKKEGYKAIPLPGDRDNAFFNIEGVIPTLIANKEILPGLQPFENDIEYLPGLVTPFDTYFLYTAPRHLFIEEAETLQSLLTPQMINASFTVWPSKIRELDADGIFRKIVHRRDNLVEYAKEFRAILDERELLTMPLKGSEELELKGALLKCFDCSDGL